MKLSIFNKTVICLVVALCSANLFAATFYVSNEGTATSPYNTWQRAANDIQTAVDLAELYTGPHNIIVDNRFREYGVAPAQVEAGAYNLVNNDREVLHFKSYRNGDNPDKESPTFGATIEIKFLSPPVSNARIIHLRLGSSINGFNIKNGNAVSPDDETAHGGGIYAVGNNDIINCVIDNCDAPHGNGGGVYGVAAGGLDMSACTIKNSEARSDGGGLYYYSANEMLLDNNVFLNNVAGSYGGGAYINKIWEPAKNLIKSCRFENNSAGIDGGGLLLIYSNPEGYIYPNATNAVFYGNYAGRNGGGFYFDTDGGKLYGGIWSATEFSYNIAKENAGAFYLTGNGCILGDEIVLHHNSASNGYGGAIFADEGFYFGNRGNATFYNNVAKNGSAIYNQNSSGSDSLYNIIAYNNVALDENGATLHLGLGEIYDFDIYDNTGDGIHFTELGKISSEPVVMNHCKIYNNDGNGIVFNPETNQWSGSKNSAINNSLIVGNDIGVKTFCFRTESTAANPPNLYNCTIYNNSREAVWAYDDGMLKLQTKLYNSIIYNDGYEGAPSSLTFAYSCVTPAQAGNISSNPDFISTDINHRFGYRLESDSPCINSGRDSLAPPGTAPYDPDLAGLPRVIEDRVDMGCYEMYPPVAFQVTNYQSQVILNKTVMLPDGEEGLVTKVKKIKMDSYADTSFRLYGTNLNLTSRKFWINDRDGSSHWFTGSGNAWNRYITGLEPGINGITVGGTNELGIFDYDYVEITRPVLTNYVSLTGSHESPFDTWATAATNCQPALDYLYQGGGGCTIVRDGSYVDTTSTISVPTNVFFISESGCENVFIEKRSITIGKNSFAVGFTFRDCGGKFAIRLNPGSFLVFSKVVDCHAHPDFCSGVVEANSAVIMNCLIYDNDQSAAPLPTVFLEGNSKIISSTVVDNNPGASEWHVDGAMGSSARNCIFYWGSEYGVNVGAVSCYNSCLFKGSGSNIGDNPLFVDRPNNNYEITPESPCVNAGNNGYVNPLLTEDLNGDDRIKWGTVDMGAFEVQEMPLPPFIDVTSIETDTIDWGTGEIPYVISGTNSNIVGGMYVKNLSAPNACSSYFCTL